VQQAAKQVASIQNIVICFEELLFLITSFCYLQFSTKQKNRRSLGGCFHQKEENSEKQGPGQSAAGRQKSSHLVLDKGSGLGMEVGVDRSSVRQIKLRVLPIFWLAHKPTQKQMRGIRSQAARLI